MGVGGIDLVVEMMSLASLAYNSVLGKAYLCSRPVDLAFLN